MILTTSALTHFLQNRRFTWGLSQKRSFSNHLATANPNGTARCNTSKTPLWNCKSQWNYDANVSLSQNPAPVQRNASPFLHDIPLSCKSQWNSGANWHVTHPSKVTFLSSPQRQCHRERIRTLANGCGRLRTVANIKATTGEHSSTLRLPKLNENPSLRIREKAKQKKANFADFAYPILARDFLPCIWDLSCLNFDLLNTLKKKQELRASCTIACSLFIAFVCVTLETGTIAFSLFCFTRLPVPS